METKSEWISNTGTRNFTEVEKGESLIYINSLLDVGIAVNQGSFTDLYGVKTGMGWKIRFSRI